jgi:biopolymer transport protein TolQ
MMSTVTVIPLIGLASVMAFERAFATDIVQMVVHAGLMVKFVLLILLFFSVVSWTIIFMKWRLFQRARQDNAFFMDMYWESTEFNKIYEQSNDLRFSPLAYLFRSGYTELKKISKLRAGSANKEGNPSIEPFLDTVERTLRKAAMYQNNKAEQTLSFLATAGNTAPFIGLFGTVWGIMESFRGIGLQASASLAVVAPGISEALIATAAGLAAAIPAVVAFNYFSRKAMSLRSEMDAFTSDFLTLVERYLLKRQMAKDGE